MVCNSVSRDVQGANLAQVPIIQGLKRTMDGINNNDVIRALIRFSSGLDCPPLGLGVVGPFLHSIETSR
jgi:hypothetical protein